MLYTGLESKTTEELISMAAASEIKLANELGIRLATSVDTLAGVMNVEAGNEFTGFGSTLG